MLPALAAVEQETKDGGAQDDQGRVHLGES